MTGEAAGHGDERWQLDGDAAELYQRHLVPAITAIWAADLVERVGLRRGERVLDVACGTGVVARAAAERVERAGHVAGIDINAAMLAVARLLPAGPGASVGWFRGSALSLPFPAGSYDVVLCQLGSQFFPIWARTRRRPSGPSTHSRTRRCCGRWPPEPDSAGSRS
jgi:SAM-dependent methyltransferase